MEDEEGANSVKKALEQCTMVQSMIEISAHHLYGLRTKCVISAELTQQEIRTLECKLIKLFSRQLLNKTKVRDETLLPQEVQRQPFLRQWLLVVGLSETSIDSTCSRVTSLEALLELSSLAARGLLVDAGAPEEEARRLVSALHNLKTYTDYQLKGEDHSVSEFELHWDSWDRDVVPLTPRSIVSCNAFPLTAITSSSSTLPAGHHYGSNGYGVNGPLGSPASSPVPRSMRQGRTSGRSSVPSDDGPRTPHATLPSYVPPWSPATTYASTSVTSMASSSSSSSSYAESCSSISVTMNQQNHSTPSPLLLSSSPVSSREHRYTPPSTPPTLTKKGEKIKFPTTPPPRKKQTITNLVPEVYPLTKSKSHESQLANRVEIGDGSLLSPMTPQAPNSIWIGRSYEHLPRRQRLATEPNLDTGSPFEGSSVPSDRSSPQVPSPVRSPPYNSLDQHSLPDESNNKTPLPVPKSPRTPTIPGYHMGHFISHRFTKSFKMTTCDFCTRQMFFGFKCKECKFKCHRDCCEKVPPSCGLPNEFLDVYRQTLQNDENPSPVLPRVPLSSPLPKEGNHQRRRRRNHPNISISPFPGADSSSNTSSCNSSTPSSPALAAMATPTPPPSAAHYQQFHFPDVIIDKGVTIEPIPLTDSKNEMVETQKSNDSDKTVSGTSGSTDSEKTLAGRVDSQDSQISDVDPLERSWPRQNSLSMREWDIPYDELNIGDKVGTGRFGTVYKGNWHGDVAIKVLNMDHMDDDKTLDAFKQEVATFRKTRHENLVLFMGACMKPPRLAIITSLCKGMTLYSHIHLRKERFNMNKAIIIAQQILQGMGYLHARGIVHKDLKTKNIFFENGKVVITDFGLFSVTKLCYGNRKGNWLTIPPGWLCYLAPEIVCRLRAAHDCHENDNLPFTMLSDVYAFGTVWYELLCCEWPFKGQPPEAIIWQVGRGIKQSLASIQASRDVKDILMMCWSFKPSERPDFSNLLRILEKLPKKRLARSPSHPIHLSRSAESVF